MGKVAKFFRNSLNVRGFLFFTVYPYLKELTKKPPIRHTDKEPMKLAIIMRLIGIRDNKSW